jgi:hypothetical protein
MIFSRDTRELINTFHVARTAGWDLTSMNALAVAVKNWWDTIYKTGVPSNITLNEVQVRQYNPLDPLAFDFPVSPVIAGTRGGLTAAANDTVTMSERTGRAGRAFRGRMYVPGVSLNDISQTDTIGSALSVILYNSLANLIFGTLPAGDVLAIFHRPGLVPRVRDNTYTPVLTALQENILDSQRRRLPGRGR